MFGRCHKILGYVFFFLKRQFNVFPEVNIFHHSMYNIRKLKPLFQINEKNEKRKRTKGMF